MLQSGETPHAAENEVQDFTYREEAPEEAIVFEEDPEDVRRHEMSQLAERIRHGNDDLQVLRDMEANPQKYRDLFKARGIRSPEELSVRVLESVANVMKDRIKLASQELEILGEKTVKEPLRVGQPIYAPEGRQWLSGKVVSFSEALGRYEVLLDSGKSQLFPRRMLEAWQGKPGQEKQLEIWDYEAQMSEAAQARFGALDKVAQAAKHIAEKAGRQIDLSALYKNVGAKERH